MAGEFETGMNYVDAAAGTAGKVLDVGQKGVDIWSSIEGVLMAKRKEKRANQEFDMQFQENVRRFGLQQALNDFATRKGIALNEAQSLYNAKQLENQTATTQEGLKTSALGRNIAETQFRWQQEDRTSKTNRDKAFAKGMVTGLMGGK